MRWNAKKGWTAPEAEENYVMDVYIFILHLCNYQITYYFHSCLHISIAQEKMCEMKDQRVEEDGIALSDAQITEKVLGKRSGYVMGLGHGVVPSSRRRHRIAQNEEELDQLRERAEVQDQELVALRAWKAAQEEATRKQQQMIDDQASRQRDIEKMLKALGNHYGLTGKCNICLSSSFYSFIFYSLISCELVHCCVIKFG